MSSLTTKLKRWIAGFVIASMTLASNAQTITYFHNDPAGSPAVVTDAAGSVVWKETYKPYGEKVNNQAASSGNKIGYAGKPFDDNTGLTYMGARYYDPVLGRFMGIDPVDLIEHEVHSFNRYTYANNNPNKYIDPDGEHPALIVLGVNMGLGALIGAGSAALTNSLIQYHETGTVQFGGAGGVLNAAGDGALIGALFGAVGGGQAGSAAGALSAARNPTKGAKPDFIVSRDGAAIHSSPDKVRSSLEGAGFSGKPISNKSGTESGTIHNVPGMKMDIRVMNGSQGGKDPRVVTNRQGSGQPVNPKDGSNFGNVPRTEQRERSHINFP